MKEIVRRSIKQLNDLLPKEKKLEIKDATILVGEKSNLESIDLVKEADEIQCINKIDIVQK